MSEPRTYPDIVGEVTGRAETHRIVYKLALPFVEVQLDDWQSPFYVHSATLAFTSLVDDVGGRWVVEMAIGGQRTPDPDDAYQVYAQLRYDPCAGIPAAEAWPAALALIADQLHPDRPGGWPGSDPEGSYL